MRRLLGILIAAILIGFAVAWIAGRQGALLFTIDGYEIAMAAPTAIGLAILSAASVAFLTRIVASVLGTPDALRGWTSARKLRRGQEALSRGLVAAAAGDPAEARRQAAKAQALLGAPPLTLLLTAQAAQLDGDDDEQARAYHKMLDDPDTEFLGLRGLFMLAMRNNDNGQAMEFAARAHGLKPRALWAANALFDLKSARRQWADARQVLEDSARARIIDSGMLRRRRAVLLAAEAQDAENKGDGQKALDLALKALELAPSLVPAAVLAARKLARQGKAWRAQDVVEAAWAQSPHPDLAAAYAVIKPEESADARAQRLIGLAHLNRDHFESRILEAEQNLNIADWAEARRVLQPLARGFASARVCALMAEIEQGQEKNAAAAHAWLARAVRAPHDAQWRCNVCGWTSPEWQPACGHCSGFDTLSWTAPDEETVSTMPGAAGDARLGADVTPSSLHQDGALQIEAEPRRPKPVRRIAEPADGFVPPRPPDDPGTDNLDSEPESQIRGGEE